MKLLARTYDRVRASLDEATRTPEMARSLAWRLGMVFACAVEFVVFTLAVRRVARAVERVGMGDDGFIFWLAHHYWLAIGAWALVVTGLWGLMTRFEEWERVVMMGAIVLHLIAIAVALGSIVTPIPR